MQYMGGKHFLAKRLAKHIAELRSGRPYLEPFVGGAHVVCRVEQGVGRFAGDANAYLITMWKELLKGWAPPDSLTRDEWMALKDRMDVRDPMTAFAGIGCAYMGKWFGGPVDIAKRTSIVLMRQKEQLRGTVMMARPYWKWTPKNTMIYCDPPYADTAGYMTGEFDHERFWITMRTWAKLGNTVLVSEYNAPDDIPVLEVWPVKGGMKANRRATEKLYVMGMANV